MKRINILMLALLAMTILIGGCEKDNFEPPHEWLTGRLTYQGNTFYLDGNSTNGDDELIQFFQEGWGKYEGWPIRIKEDGTFSALLFKGEYKLMVRSGDYPFEWTGWPKNDKGEIDTMIVQLNGDLRIPDIEVTPYFEINNIDITGGAFVTATFDLKEVLPESGVKVEKAYLYMGPGELVHSASLVNQSVENIDVTKPVTIKMPIAKYRDGYINNFRDYGFCRIALKLSNTTRMLWSKTYKVENLPLSLNDISARYLKNYAAPFQPEEGCPQADSYSTPADWTVNSAMRVYGPEATSGKMYGGLELRFGRNCIGAINYDLGDPAPAMVNGKMYQTITLPAGHYIFSGTHFPEFIQNYCGPDMGFIVVAKGESIPDKNQLSTAIAYHDTFDDPSVEFTLDTETKLSVGFLFDLPTGTPHAFGFTKVSLISLE